MYIYIYICIYTQVSTRISSSWLPKQRMAATEGGRGGREGGRGVGGNKRRVCLMTNGWGEGGEGRERGGSQGAAIRGEIETETETATEATETETETETET
jgi:hypothetical protein